MANESSKSKSFSTKSMAASIGFVFTDTPAGTGHELFERYEHALKSVVASYEDEALGKGLQELMTSQNSSQVWI